MMIRTQVPTKKNKKKNWERTMGVYVMIRRIKVSGPLQMMNPTPNELPCITAYIMTLA